MTERVLRAAVAADIPTLADIECRAFGRDAPDSRAHKQRELEHELPEYVVLEESGRIVATARIQRHWLRVGGCQVLKGDVGHVAVPPEMHGQGQGTELMRRVIAHMRDEGFHLSRLGGLMKFYSRFGYEPFIRRYVHIPVPKLDEDLKGQSWREVLGMDEAAMGRVRPYHPGRDHLAVHGLRQEFDATRCGQLVTDPHPPHPGAGEPDPRGLVWVYDDGGVRGYLRGSYALVSAGDPAPRYRIDELVYEYASPEAVGALVKTLMARAQEIAPTTISCRLPYDEALFNALGEANIGFEIVEWRTAADGNMIQVINLRETLKATEPELARRLGELPELPWQGAMKLSLPHEEVVLEVGPEGVVRQDDALASFTVHATQADFVKWLFGIVGFGESPQAAGLTGAQRVVMGLVFPRLACASGPWG